MVCRWPSLLFDLASSEACSMLGQHESDTGPKYKFSQCLMLYTFLSLLMLAITMRRKVWLCWFFVNAFQCVQKLSMVVVRAIYGSDSPKIYHHRYIIKPASSFKMIHHLGRTLEIILQNTCQVCQGQSVFPQIVIISYLSAHGWRRGKIESLISYHW